MTAVMGESVTFICRTTYSVNTDITWKFNGKDVNISDTSKYKIIKITTTETVIESNLVIMSVALSDVGIYNCVAENEAGNDTSNGVLRVNG